MHHLALINPEHVSEEEAKTYATREAARAVVFDDQGLVALLHVSKFGYYKLPGGGIEEAEDPKIALSRECREEIGCDVEVLEELGSIVEYRKMFALVQTSHCWLAKVKGEKGTPDFTDEEAANGFEAIWLSYEEALATIKRGVTSDMEGSAYIVPRDIVLLEAAKEHLAKLA